MGGRDRGRRPGARDRGAGLRGGAVRAAGAGGGRAARGHADGADRARGAGPALRDSARRRPTRRRWPRSATRLAAARTPLVLAGGGGWTDAGRRALRALRRGKARCRCSPDFRWQDVIDNDSPALRRGRRAGQVGGDVGSAIRDGGRDPGARVRARRDHHGRLYAAVGCRSPRQALIHVHADAGELNKVYAAALPVLADPDADGAGAGGSPGSGRRRRARSGWSGCGAAQRAFVAAPPQPGALDMAR